MKRRAGAELCHDVIMPRRSTRLMHMEINDTHISTSTLHKSNSAPWGVGYGYGYNMENNIWRYDTSVLTKKQSYAYDTQRDAHGYDTTQDYQYAYETNMYATKTLYDAILYKEPSLNIPQPPQKPQQQPQQQPPSPQPPAIMHNDQHSLTHYVCSDTTCLAHIDRHIMVATVSCMLQTLCDQNQSCITSWLHKYGHTTTPTPYITLFHGIRIPDISIYQYLSRIGEATRCSSTIFPFIYIYILRYHESHIKVKRGCTGVSMDTDYPWECNAINHLTIHRLILTCMLIASKFHEDEAGTNSSYAMMGGITLSELNNLELSLLKSLDFQLYVSHTLFFSYYSDITYHSKQPRVDLCHGFGPHQYCTWSSNIPVTHIQDVPIMSCDIS